MSYSYTGVYRPAMSDRKCEKESLLPKQQGRHHARSQSKLCIQSRAAILIILWTLFIGFAFTSMLIVETHAIINSYNWRKTDKVVTYPATLLFGGMAVVALLNPVTGFMADISCGRFKVVIFCFGLVVFSYLACYICSMAYVVFEVKHPEHPKVPSAIGVMGFISLLLTFIGFAGYQANFIQLGLDQQTTAPSEDLALFVHWAMWAHNVGCTLITVIVQPYQCDDVNVIMKITVFLVPFFLAVFFIVVLIFTCFKHRWFTSGNVRHQNPCKLIFKVLSFARKHKFPLFRSAFTFSDDERPSRLDFAKERFGGPFTTEQVEDTKSFFKILAVLLALGPVFTMDVPSSYLGLVTFGYHAGDVHNLNDSNGLLDNCSHWALVWSGSLKYIFGTFFFPIYIWLVFSYLRHRIPRMFVRLFSGIILYLLGNLFLIAIDLIGHRLLYNHAASSDEVASLCMFDYRGSSSRHLDMHWSFMLPPSFLFGIGPLIVMTTTLEFISAQSPHFMKGLLVGMLFAIIGFFQLIGALSFIPFSVRDIWFTKSMSLNPPITNCGFGYLLFTFTVAFTGLILFVVVAKKYTYRVRDDRPYNQSQVEEIVSRYLERPIHDYCDVYSS